MLTVKASRDDQTHIGACIYQGAGARGYRMYVAIPVTGDHTVTRRSWECKMKRGTNYDSPPIRNVETQRNTGYDDRQVPTRRRRRTSVPVSIRAYERHMRPTWHRVAILRIRRPGDLGDDVMRDAICIQSGSTRPCEEVTTTAAAEGDGGKLHGDMKCTRTANLNNETIRNCGQADKMKYAPGLEATKRPDCKADGRTITR